MIKLTVDVLIAAMKAKRRLNSLFKFLREESYQHRAT